MLKYGTGLGVRAVLNGLSKLFDIDALRPPTASNTFFKRTIGSTNYIPMAIGQEGSGSSQNGTATISSGVSAISSIGNATISGNANKVISGNTATISIGTVTPAGSARTSVIGISAAGYIGSVSFPVNALVLVSGIESVSSLGIVSAIGKSGTSGAFRRRYISPAWPVEKENVSVAITTDGISAKTSVGTLTIIASGKANIEGINVESGIGNITAFADYSIRRRREAKEMMAFCMAA